MKILFCLTVSPHFFLIITSLFYLFWRFLQHNSWFLVSIMACAINFSPRTMLIYAQRCCKISQNPKFRYFSTSLVGKLTFLNSWFLFNYIFGWFHWKNAHFLLFILDRRRSLSKKNTKCFQLSAEEARIEHLLDEFDRKLARMHSDFPDVCILYDFLMFYVCPIYNTCIWLIKMTAGLHLKAHNQLRIFYATSRNYCV